MSKLQRFFNFIAVFGFFLAVAILFYTYIGKFCLGSFCLGPFFLDLHKTSTFWGIAVSAVALVITCYFVILAREAYKLEQDAVKTINKLEQDAGKTINQLVSESKKVLETLEESQKNLKGSQQSLAELTWELCTQQYYILCKQGNGGSIGSKMLLVRGRLGYLFPMLEQPKRIQCIRSDLAKYGIKEDMLPLRNIYDDPYEPPEIRKSAKFAHNAIAARIS